MPRRTATRLDGYIRQIVITPASFVITAQCLQDYPGAIRQKPLRELGKAAS